MFELSSVKDGLLKQSIGGDVYNTAVYLKRVFPSVDAGLFTCVGHDSISDSMLAQFNAEGLNNSLINQSDNLIPGAYLINTDDEGERTFVYWRDNSAARQVMKNMTHAQAKNLEDVDMFFFSGISLAILPEEDLSAFFELVTKLKSAGCKIVFDPNYRARLWQTPAKAKQAFEQSFELSDLLLPGVDDFKQLYQLETGQQIQAFLASYSIDEVVIKDGPQMVTCIKGSQTYNIEITPVNHVVDTTSAGDSFNGVYLGARLSGMTIEESVKLAAQAAAIVIQYSGAIVPKQSFTLSRPAA